MSAPAPRRPRRAPASYVDYKAAIHITADQRVAYNRFPAGRRPARRHLGQLQRDRLRHGGAQREHGAHPGARRGLDHLQPGHHLGRGPDRVEGSGGQPAVHHADAVPGAGLDGLAAGLGASVEGRLGHRRTGRSSSSRRCGRTAGCTPRPVPPASSRASTSTNPPPFDPTPPGPDAIPMTGDRRHRGHQRESVAVQRPIRGRHRKRPGVAPPRHRPAPTRRRPRRPADPDRR